MYAAMTVNDFNTYLTSEQQQSDLLSILRKLTKIQKPEDVLVAAKEQPVGPMASWSGWSR